MGALATNHVARSLTILVALSSAQLAPGSVAYAVSTVDSTSGSVVGLYLVIVVAMLAFGLWAAWEKSVTRQLQTPRVARNLFLGFSYSENQKEFRGYLRSLELRTATFVAPQFHAKGDKLSLDLGALPGFPGQDAKVMCEVTGTRIMRGDPATYVVTVRLLALDEPDRKSLINYITNLTSPPGKLSHA